MKKAWIAFKKKVTGRNKSEDWFYDPLDINTIELPDDDNNYGIDGPLYKTFAAYLPMNRGNHEYSPTIPRNRLFSKHGAASNQNTQPYSYRQSGPSELESVTSLVIPAPSILNFRPITPKQATSSKIIRRFIVPSNINKVVTPEAKIKRDPVTPRPSPTFNGLVKISTSEPEHSEAGSNRYFQ